MVYATLMVRPDFDELDFEDLNWDGFVLTDFAGNSCSVNEEEFLQLLCKGKICLLGFNTHASESASFTTLIDQLKANRVDWILHGAQSLKALGLCGTSVDTSRLKISKQEILVRSLVRTALLCSIEGEVTKERVGTEWRYTAFCKNGYYSETIDSYILSATNIGGLNGCTFMNISGLAGKLFVSFSIKIDNLSLKTVMEVLEKVSQGKEYYKSNPYEIVRTVNWFANHNHVNFQMCKGEDIQDRYTVSKDEAIEYWISYLLGKFGLEIKTKDEEVKR